MKYSYAALAFASSVFAETTPPTTGDVAAANANTQPPPTGGAYEKPAYGAPAPAPVAPATQQVAPTDATIPPPAAPAYGNDTQQVAPAAAEAPKCVPAGYATPDVAATNATDATSQPTLDTTQAQLQSSSGRMAVSGLLAAVAGFAVYAL